MTLKFEKIYPYLFGAIAMSSYNLFFSQYQLPHNTKDLFAAIVTIASIAVGFLATMKSILLTLGNSSIVRKLKQTEHYTLLKKYLMAAINLGFLCAIASAVFLLFDFSNKNSFNSWLISVWVFIAVTFLVANYRIIKILYKILN